MRRISRDFIIGTRLLRKIYKRASSTSNRFFASPFPAASARKFHSWIAFVTWSEEDGGHLYKVAVAGRSGKAQRLSTISAFYDEPVWTPDGKEIVVAKGPWQQRRALSYFNFIPGAGMDLVRISALGGAATRIAPYKGTTPHFADKPDRLYLYEGATSPRPARCPARAFSTPRPACSAPIKSKA
jgi:hypothetical protein